MKYRIKWVDSAGEEGYGFLIYDIKEKAQETVGNMNKDGNVFWEIVDELDE